jgi:hypothetical protein
VVFVLVLVTCWLLCSGKAPVVLPTAVERPTA